MAKSFMGCIRKVIHLGLPSASIPNLTELQFPLDFSLPLNLLNVTGDLDFHTLIVTGLTDLNVTKIGGDEMEDGFNYKYILKWPVIGFKLYWNGNVSENGQARNKSGFLM